MELNITHLVGMDLKRFCSSINESGVNAGKMTWDNALVFSANNPLLHTLNQLTVARSYFEDFGAWSEDELNLMKDVEVNALLLQEISAQLREMESFETYEDYEKAQESGTVSGNIFKGNNNQFYFYVGN